jgi:hypothetical protein
MHIGEEISMLTVSRGTVVQIQLLEPWWAVACSSVGSSLPCLIRKVSAPIIVQWFHFPLLPCRRHRKIELLVYIYDVPQIPEMASVLMDCMPSPLEELHHL